jgi:hypothetical protein
MRSGLTRAVDSGEGPGGGQSRLTAEPASGRRRITDCMPVPSCRVLGVLVLAGALAAACAPATHTAASPARTHGAEVAVGEVANLLAPVPPFAVCAAMPGVLIPPTSVAPELITTSLGGEPAPVLLGQPTPGTAIPAPRFEWTEEENAAARHLPPDFGPRNPSVLVSEFPTRIDQLIETANTFVTTNDTVRWFATWPGVSALLPQEVEPGTTRNANPDVAQLDQADEVEVTNWSRADPDIPTAIQYVMRIGDTVITIEFIGGDQVTDASTEAYAAAALQHVERTCAGLLGS